MTTGSEPFGFTVLCLDGQWSVFLPYQRDRWDIVGEGHYASEAVSHETALRRLTDFIEEARAARGALIKRQEYGVGGQ
jgi:hypothetical protein